jgi:hypothetical protein
MLLCLGKSNHLRVSHFISPLPSIVHNRPGFPFTHFVLIKSIPALIPIQSLTMVSYPTSWLSMLRKHIGPTSPARQTYELFHDARDNDDW